MKKILLVFAAFYSHYAVYPQIQFEPVPGFFRTQRELPLVEMSTKQDIYVSSYGAHPNDNIDDIQGIMYAIFWASYYSTSTNPVRVIFEPGKYDLFPASPNNHTFSFNNLKYVVLEGNHAEILIHNPEAGFMLISNALNVIIKDLTIDYNKLPFTQGRVIAKDPANRSFDIAIDEGFPWLSEAYFTNAAQKWGMLKESTGKLKEGVEYLFPYTGWSQIKDNIFRVNQPSSTYINQIDIDDYFVQIARNNGKTIFTIRDSKNITFLNVTNFASPSTTFSAFNNYELNILHCKVIPRNGRVQSANADCIHISGSYLGPWVEGCRFEAVSDDAVNMKFTSREILSAISPTKLKIKYEVVVGDSISFYNPLEGKFLGKAGVTGVIDLGNFEYEITLSDPVNITNISPHQSGDKAYLNSRSTESFIFRNDTIVNGRRYGMQIQNSYGLIENCVFENLSNCGLRLENGVDWKEGFTANNITIRNNYFNNCGFDKLYKADNTAAAISARVTKLGSPCNETMTWCGVETAGWMGLENIIIEGNTIIYNKKGLHLEGIKNLSAYNNTIIHNPYDISLNGGEAIPYFVNNCTFSPNYNLKVEDLPAVNDEILIYPTLVNDWIHFSGRINGVQIFNSMGKMVLTENGVVDCLNLETLAPGIYIAHSNNSYARFIKW